MTATLYTRLLLREPCLACNGAAWCPMCNMCAALTLAEERAKTKEAVANEPDKSKV